MKPKNFPGRKKARQIAAFEKMPNSWINQELNSKIKSAREIRTKKKRG